MFQRVQFTFTMNHCAIAQRKALNRTCVLNRVIDEALLMKYLYWESSISVRRIHSYTVLFSNVTLRKEEEWV
jgi:hypothetical protein